MCWRIIGSAGSGTSMALATRKDWGNVEFQPGPMWADTHGCDSQVHFATEQLHGAALSFPQVGKIGNEKLKPDTVNPAINEREFFLSGLGNST